MSPSRNDSATESVERVRVLCLHFECHALVGLKSVDFICPQERAFVPEEDRPRQLSVTSLALFDPEYQGGEARSDYGQHIVRLHPSFVHDRRVDMAASHSECLD
jgi:hypothetical protein